MVLYRKYRPQSLNDLIGQEVVKEVLTKAIKARKVAHAYLFCGPRGSGKTSTARILAKIVNCEAKEVPCNVCLSCTSITNGTNLDVYEMDGASNRGIEDIRSLRENIKLAPSSAKKKVYIIDEVHQLSGEAFNALLKTLEEPPSHVLFILATTEPQKIPITILSRVQKLEFKQAKLADLLQALKIVAESEKIKVDDSSLNLIARKAQGSFRDAIKILDQISTLDEINELVIESLLGMGNAEESLKLISSISEGNAKEALEILQTQLRNGVSPKEFNLSLLETLKNLLYLQSGLGELVKGEMELPSYQSLEELAKKIEAKKLIGIINCFESSLEKIKYLTIPSLPLEVAVVECCLEVRENQTVRQETVRQEDSKTKDQQAIRQLDKTEESESLEVSPTSTTDDILKIQDKWGYVLETVRQNNYSLEALLRSAKIVECSGKSVILEVPYSFHQRILEAPKSRDLIESILSDILERQIRVSAILGKRPLKTEELSNIELAQDDEIVRLASEIFSSEVVN